ncbi:MAG: redox-regulated ATPase YchF [Deltaproteobacteria bacterium RIFCSPLOWO2_02_FULL_47_10]|nr:MAG: redox-regulated ATPase YchF [Deltaproteobacteria bacterium RIFCSPLOWO2_02_FULL_47_10]
MGFNCGIVGLPNVGKSSIFNALTAAHVPAENYPFCTKDHNEGIVHVPDKRLSDIAAIFKPKRVVPTAVEFVDIAGLVKDAHKGEGLGNKFLSYIREVDAVAHIVRCFENPNVVHVTGALNPISDIEIVNTELMLADLDIVEKRLQKNSTAAKTGIKEAKELQPVLERLQKVLHDGHPARKAGLSDGDMKQIKELSLITLKPVMYVANGADTDFKSPSVHVKKVGEYAKKDCAEFALISGSTEADLADMAETDRLPFLADMGLSESGLVRLIHTGYRLLDLVTFFTKDGPEVRAWTVKRGTNAPQAAGKIHTDFEKGFIKADVYTYEELMKFGNEHAIHAAGKVRSEGHDYIVKDGDIIHFKFST